MSAAINIQCQPTPLMFVQSGAVIGIQEDEGFAPVKDEAGNSCSLMRPSLRSTAMKTTFPLPMKTAALFSVSLALAISALARSTIVPIPFSAEPSTNSLGQGDWLIANSTNNNTGTQTTKRVSAAFFAGVTNPVFQTGPMPTWSMQLTNQQGISGIGGIEGGYIGATNLGDLLFKCNYSSSPSTSSNMFVISFLAENELIGEISAWPCHSGTDPEFILENPNGTMAFGAQAFQIGIGTELPSFMYMQAESHYSMVGSTNFTISVPLLFTPYIWTNGGYLSAGSLSPNYYPGLMCYASDGDGDATLGIFSSISTSHNDPVTGNVQQHGFTVGPHPGFAFSGGLTNNGVAGLTTNAPSGAALTVQNGIVTTCSGGGGLTTNIWLNPSTILSIQGGVIVGCTGLDPVVTNYVALAGITDPNAKLAVNTLVASLKSDGTWTNIQAAYPFMGTNGAQQAINLVGTTNFNITWEGTNFFTTNGVTGDGFGGYGSTHYSGLTNGMTTNSAHIYVYQSATNPPPHGADTEAIFMGVLDSPSYHGD